MSESTDETDAPSALDIASGVPFQDEGWRALYISMLPSLLHVSPRAVFDFVSTEAGRAIVNCRYVPPDDEIDPEMGFHVFTELLNLLEIRSQSVCQVCGLRGQWYRENPIIAYTLCPRHANEFGYVDLSDTRIENR